MRARRFLRTATFSRSFAKRSSHARGRFHFRATIIARSTESHSNCCYDALRAEVIQRSIETRDISQQRRSTNDVFLLTDNRGAFIDGSTCTAIIVPLSFNISSRHVVGLVSRLRFYRFSHDYSFIFIIIISHRRFPTIAFLIARSSQNSVQSLNKSMRNKCNTACC